MPESNWRFTVEYAGHYAPLPADFFSPSFDISVWISQMHWRHNAANHLIITAPDGAMYVYVAPGMTNEPDRQDREALKWAESKGFIGA